jgi:hypothetical protein
MSEIRLTEETLNHMPAIVRVAGEYGVTIMDLLGPGKQEKLVAARVALCRVLRQTHLSHSTIGRVIGRDRTTVRDLIGRKLNPTPAYFVTREAVAAADAPPREHTAQRYKDHCERGSKALAAAIFATGKTHGPMPEQKLIDAMIWSRGADGNVHRTGWMV